MVAIAAETLHDLPVDALVRYQLHQADWRSG